MENCWTANCGRHKRRIIFPAFVPLTAQCCLQIHDPAEDATLDGGEDYFRVDHHLLHLPPKRQRVGHEVVRQAGAPLGVAADGGEGGLLYNGGSASRTSDLVEHVLCHLQIREPGKVVVDGDPLVQGLMDG